MPPKQFQVARKPAIGDHDGARRQPARGKARGERRAGQGQPAERQRHCRPTVLDARHLRESVIPCALAQAVQACPGLMPVPGRLALAKLPSARPCRLVKTIGAAQPLRVDAPAALNIAPRELARREGRERYGATEPDAQGMRRVVERGPIDEPREGARAERTGPVTFDRRELDRILQVYGRMVADGEWRDYAIDFMNPAPDADYHSVGEENFTWIVETMAEFLAQLALLGRRPMEADVHALLAR